MPWYCLSLWMGYAVWEWSCFLFTHFSWVFGSVCVCLCCFFVGSFSFRSHCYCNLLFFFQCPWLSFVTTVTLYFTDQSVAVIRVDYRTGQSENPQISYLVQLCSLHGSDITFVCLLLAVVSSHPFHLRKKRQKQRKDVRGRKWELSESKINKERQRWAAVERKQGNGRWKLEDVEGFSGSDWLSLWSQVFIIPSCDALISPFFCTE